MDASTVSTSAHPGIAWTGDRPAARRTLTGMSFDYEEKPSTSRFVDIFWQTHDTSDGTYLAAADACWDMIFIRSVHGIRALLSGPSSTTTPSRTAPAIGTSASGSSRLVPDPRPGHGHGRHDDALPMTGHESFLLAGRDWPMPTYETAEDFVAELERLELLSDDPVVMPRCGATRRQRRPRSVQRHCLAGHRADREPDPDRSFEPGGRRDASSAASRSST